MHLYHLIFDIPKYKIDRDQILDNINIYYTKNKIKYPHDVPNYKFRPNYKLFRGGLKLDFADKLEKWYYLHTKGINVKTSIPIKVIDQILIKNNLNIDYNSNWLIKILLNDKFNINFDDCNRYKLLDNISFGLTKKLMYFILLRRIFYQFIYETNPYIEEPLIKDTTNISYYGTLVPEEINTKFYFRDEMNMNDFKLLILKIIY